MTENGLREDQRTAMAELERLQNTRPEEWDEEHDEEFRQLLEEPGPDYEETRARLQQLNAQLESEPQPKEESRKTKIRFSENLVQEAPNQAENDTDSEHEHNCITAQPSGERHAEEDESPRSQKVLVVTDGQYSFVDSSEVAASRPKSAAGVSKSRGQQQQHRRFERPTSAPVRGHQKQHKTEERTQQDEERTHQDEERRQQNEAAFEAWLRTKKTAEQQRRRQSAHQQNQESKQGRQEENERAYEVWLKTKNSKAEQERRKAQEARKLEEEQQEERRLRDTKERIPYEQWLQAKREQHRREELATRDECAESDTHSEEERRRAFRQWLRSKEEQRKQEEKQERQRARITRLALRRSRKSQALANALAAANCYRYLDR